MTKQREHWGSRLGFILAAAGSAVGLGTLWKFPYVTGQNGGGLFVLVYLLCTLLIGIPLFMAELMLGRRAQRGAVGIFDALSPKSSFWKSAGWLGVISSILIMSFYSVVAGWGLNYILMSLNQSLVGRGPEEVQQTFELLASSGDITLFWHLLFTGITMALVLPGVRHGLEYWTRIMTSTLLVLLLGLALYNVTLDGFGDAVRFIFYPDTSQFTAGALLEALGLAFFTLSLGQGIMLTYGSYMRPEEDIPQTALIIGVMILAVSVLAGLVVFPVIFTFNVPPEGGAGLVFKTLPLLFSNLPGSVFVSTAFFVLFVFTALTSSMAFIEVGAANLIDLLGWSRKKAVLGIGITCFVLGIPSALSDAGLLFANWQTIYGKTFFDTINDLVSVWLLPIGGLMITIFTGWVLAPEASRNEFQKGTSWTWLWAPWFFFIRWVVPIAILAILLQKADIIDIDALISH